MNNERKLREASRAANRQVLSRSIILMILFGVLIFIPLILQLFQLQIVRHDELEEMAVQQQTSKLTVSSSRGTIYTTDGNVLAISSTVYDVIISPKAIVEKQQDMDEKLARAIEKEGDTSPYDWNVEDAVCTNLAAILDLDEGELREKCQDTNSQYKRIAVKLDRETEEEVRTFIDSSKVSGCVYLQENTRRYYPYGSMAASIIGFTNDSGGAYGLEALYEEQLSGKAGLTVTAQNGAGTDLMNFFQDYYDAQNGDNYYLTIDPTIQSYCESYLEEYTEKYECQNGGLMIVMECDTGAILGMAQSPTFDLNEYSVISDPILLEQLDEEAREQVEASEEAVKAAIELAEAEERELTEEEKTPLDYDTAYQQLYADALYSLWTNKAITETYEPGSTFKAMVLAAALEEGVISDDMTFDCSGQVFVGDWEEPIRCTARYGHGVQNLEEAVGHSCNPAFITIGQKLGRETFYDYLYAFGLMDPTGIDLPYEGSSYFWDYEDFGIVNLATASFGQRFNVTPIQLITAFNAVVNGGYLRTPYVVETVTDSEGNTIFEADTTPVRQVISEATSERCTEILEGVVAKYTGKQAYMPGCRIGGKTGTSQTLVDDEYIVSFVGFAPANDPDIIALVMFDRPKVSGEGSSSTAAGYSVYGGQMAAPVAGELIAEVLDYRGHTKEFSSDDLTGAMTAMPDLSGMTEAEAELKLDEKKLHYRVVGSGDTITGQIPSAGNYVPQNSTVILYMGEEVPTEPAIMPNLIGKDPEEAMEALNKVGLFMNATGTSGFYTSTTVCTEQGVDAGKEIQRGRTITIRFSDPEAADADSSALD
ncbi:MAG: PASTA domain-containing protein [Oscillospiraceae bacterium]|nr:PASTA domain-containing protein [Oscillospiraceae bacterium]